MTLAELWNATLDAPDGADQIAELLLREAHPPFTRLPLWRTHDDIMLGHAVSRLIDRLQRADVDEGRRAAAQFVHGHHHLLVASVDGRWFIDDIAVGPLSRAALLAQLRDDPAVLRALNAPGECLPECDNEVALRELMEETFPIRQGSFLLRVESWDDGPVLMLVGFDSDDEVAFVKVQPCRLVANCGATESQTRTFLRAWASAVRVSFDKLDTAFAFEHVLPAHLDCADLFSKLHHLGEESIANVLLEPQNLGRFGPSPIPSFGSRAEALQACAARGDLHGADLTILDAWGTSLTGIEGLSGLGGLRVSSNQLDSLQPLLAHRGLRRLWLDTSVDDISVLAELAALQVLDMPSYRGPIHALHGLGSLRELSLGQAAQEHTWLANLTELRVLDLRHSNLEDLTPLSGLEKLESLNVYGTSVTDLRPLHDLEHLRWVLLPRTAQNVDAFRQARPDCVVHGID